VSNESWGQILLDRIDATERRIAAEVREAVTAIDLAPGGLDEGDLDAAIDPLRAEVERLAAAVERLARAPKPKRTPGKDSR